MSKETETNNPAIPETDDEMRALLMEAEESKFWEEEPGEPGEEPRMPFPMFPGMGFPFMNPLDAISSYEEEAYDEDDDEENADIEKSSDL